MLIFYARETAGVFIKLCNYCNNDSNTKKKDQTKPNTKINKSQNSINISTYYTFIVLTCLDPLKRLAARFTAATLFLRAGAGWDGAWT